MKKFINVHVFILKLTVRSPLINPKYWLVWDIKRKSLKLSIDGIAVELRGFRLTLILILTNKFEILEIIIILVTKGLTNVITKTNLVQ